MRRAMGLVAVLGTVAAAQPIDIPLYNTGVDDAGLRLPGGSVDPHWQIVSGPGSGYPAPAIVVTNQHPGGNYFETLDSTWIWVAANGTGSVGSPYAFRVQFDLTGYDLDSLSISGAWGADNTANMFLNGASPIGSGTFSLPNVVLDSHNALHSFSISGGFVAGLNSLEIQVVDARNPGGLNVSGLIGQANAVPEASNFALFVSGLAVMFVANRRLRVRFKRVVTLGDCPRTETP
jgi:hypothetical protein